jgi:N6-adenosine-specific RNA methylase IME4
MPKRSTNPLSSFGMRPRVSSIVLLWSIAPMLLEALETLSAWGAKYLSQIVWRKITKNGKVRVGTGYHRVRSCHELVLLASFGGRQRHAAFPSIFDGLAREHSRKPEEFYRMVVEHTPGQERCDLFSRETRPGFIGWGKEHGKFDRISYRVARATFLMSHVPASFFWILR